MNEQEEWENYNRTMKIFRILYPNSQPTEDGKLQFLDRTNKTSNYVGCSVYNDGLGAYQQRYGCNKIYSIEDGQKTLVLESSYRGFGDGTGESSYYIRKGLLDKLIEELLEKN